MSGDRASVKENTVGGAFSTPASAKKKGVYVAHIIQRGPFCAGSLFSKRPDVAAVAVPVGETSKPHSPSRFASIRKNKKTDSPLTQHNRDPQSTQCNQQ
jgi:hypothetical protein